MLLSRPGLAIALIKGVCPLLFFTSKLAPRSTRNWASCRESMEYCAVEGGITGPVGRIDVGAPLDYRFTASMPLPVVLR